MLRRCRHAAGPPPPGQPRAAAAAAGGGGSQFAASTRLALLTPVCLPSFPLQICLGPVCVPVHLLLAFLVGLAHQHGYLKWFKVGGSGWWHVRGGSVRAGSREALGREPAAAGRTAAIKGRKRVGRRVRERAEGATNRGSGSGSVRAAWHQARPGPRPTIVHPCLLCSASG